MTSFSTPSHAPPGASHVPSATGDVLIYDALKGEAVTILEAHKSPLSAVTINNEGTLLATASDKGTIIRVFSIPGAQKLYQFRRGTYPARIYSMNFNLVSTLLCVSSATETVHIFRVGNFPAAQHAERPSLQSASSSRSSTSMGRSRSQSSDVSSIYSDSTIMNAPPSFLNSQQQEKPHNERGYGIGSMFRRSSQSLGKTMVGAVGGYLPSAVTEMWEPARHFASVKLPESGIKSVVALSSTSPRVMVVTSEGLFYMYNIDMENGGECVLMKQYS
jgi:autophagy-related protein 18